jgi:hypothetical protein
MEWYRKSRVGLRADLICGARGGLRGRPQRYQFKKRRFLHFIHPLLAS